MTKPLTQEAFIEKATYLHQGKYSYEKTVYTRSSAKVTVTCPKHADFEVTANNHVSLSNLCGCPSCGGTKLIGQSEFLTRATATHGSTYAYSFVRYKNNSTPVVIECPEHGCFSQTPAKHLLGRGCPVCGGTKRRDTPEWLARAQHKHKGIFDYSNVPPTAKGSDVVAISCPVHGVFTQQLKLHAIRGYGCFRCNHKSAPEDQIAIFIESLGFPVQRSAPVLGKQHIDVFIPSRNFGVELHGLHWHLAQHKGVDYHRNKWQKGADAGIRLIQVFEDEWNTKKDIVKARITAMLGLGAKYAARKCAVRECSQDGKAFLDAHHIQGAGRAALYYGLYFEDALIAVASFGPARSGAMVTGAGSAWEVIRYASTGRVRGGFGKLFQHFLRGVKPVEVVSYCDLRYGDGKLYAATGFHLDSITPPDYWWVPAGKIQRVPRYTTQKHKLKNHPILGAHFDPAKTENQICEAAGWGRIFGVGHQKWIWKPLDTPNPV